MSLSVGRRHASEQLQPVTGSALVLLHSCVLGTAYRRSWTQRCHMKSLGMAATRFSETNELRCPEALMAQWGGYGLAIKGLVCV